MRAQERSTWHSCTQCSCKSSNRDRLAKCNWTTFPRVNPFKNIARDSNCGSGINEHQNITQLKWNCIKILAGSQRNDMPDWNASVLLSSDSLWLNFVAAASAASYSITLPRFVRVALCLCTLQSDNRMHTNLTTSAITVQEYRLPANSHQILLDKIWWQNVIHYHIIEFV